MIINETVFVLGAGASNEYGYPLGVELIKELEKLTADKKFFPYLQAAYPDIKVEDNYKIFLRAAKEPPATTIDKFLEHNPIYQPIGKFALTYYFLKKDQEDFEANEIYARGWYQNLFNEIMYQRSFSDFLKNKITFVSFNYDVSLERFFRAAIRNIYKSEINEQGIKLFFEKIRTFHVHGSVRNFSWQSHDEIGLDQVDLGFKEIKNISEKNIKLTGDGWNHQVYWMKDVISKAERVIFLGFGFHLDNVAKLQIDWLSKKTFESTATKITNAKKRVINRDLCSGKVTFRNMNCNEYLNERLDFLTS